MIHARSSHIGRRWSLSLGAVTIAASVAAGSVGMVGCASSPDNMVLGLAYQPTSQPDASKLQGAQPILATMRVWINPVIDRHPEGSQIGVSEEEDNKPVYFGPNGLPPADFVRSALVPVLAAYAVPVAPDANTHTHVLQIEMTRFWTLEDNNYQATIGGSVVLADRAGHVLWKAEIVGASKHHGRTFTDPNYQQAFSDAALDFGSKIALDPGFRAAMNVAG
jgi:hypothetical protein